MHLAVAVLRHGLVVAFFVHRGPLQARRGRFDHVVALVVRHEVVNQEYLRVVAAQQLPHRPRAPAPGLCSREGVTLRTVVITRARGRLGRGGGARRSVVAAGVVVGHGRHPREGGVVFWHRGGAHGHVAARVVAERLRELPLGVAHPAQLARHRGVVARQARAGEAGGQSMARREQLGQHDDFLRRVLSCSA